MHFVSQTIGFRTVLVDDDSDACIINVWGCAGMFLRQSYKEYNEDVT